MAPMLNLGASTAQGLRRGHTGGSLTAVLAPAKPVFIANLVQRGAECTMSSPPSQSPIRLTITVTPETHAVFKRLAEAGNMSLSRCMGEWLGDTAEAAEFMAAKMEEAREKPKQVMREMHAYALGLADQTSSMLTTMAAKSASGAASATRATTGPTPRLVIRGGKSPSKGKKT